jgi:hypothetical protein
MSKRGGGSESGDELILFTSDDGRIRLQAKFGGETAWLSVIQLAELFERDKSVIAKHIRAIYESGELSPAATSAKFAEVRDEGARSVRRTFEYFNLDVVLAVGYRVHSPRGIQFRSWATERLREYIVKGFTLDDERLKNPPGRGHLDYFDELLARIRDIRSSERVFWRKVLDIYATSADYDPSAEASRRFFATVQNKMHWAIHGQTAAEVVLRRADATKPNLGMTSWTGAGPTAQDAAIAKNYLSAEELEGLNRIVNAYLEFAELQAMSRKTMTMGRWIEKLDEFLRLSEREILTHAGSVSHEAALAAAERQYERYKAEQARLPSRVDEDFERAVRALPAPKASAKPRRVKPKGKG